MKDGIEDRQPSPPIAAEDLLTLGVESHIVPSVVSTAWQAEQSSNCEAPTLTSKEAENLVEILDQIVTSDAVNPTSRNRCFQLLRSISLSHGILPKSCFVAEVSLSDTLPYAPGGFAHPWRGLLDGRQVCVKAFPAQTAAKLQKIKRRFYNEIVGWKHASHPNVLPFCGVSEALFSFCFITPWMPNGNIIDYIRKDPNVNRLQLLAQAASGLGYLHTIAITHGDVNPGNILIDEGGMARLGDFGIAGVITDPTVVEPGSLATFKPGTVCYMAPELFSPSRFNVLSSDPTKESDIYSFAMTAYEVLTEILPYGGLQSGTIIYRVVTGKRPPRPTNTRWLQGQIWCMITACWSEKPKLRWEIHIVYMLLSLSSIRETMCAEEDAGTMIQALNTLLDALPTDPRSVQPFTQEVTVEVNNLGQELVNFIDKVLEDGDVPFADQSKLLNTLGNMCSRFKTIPDSVRIESGLQVFTDKRCEGGFATVFRGKYRGLSVAIKTVRLYLTSNLEECFSEFRREVVAWTHLRHQNILPLIGADVGQNRFAMVSEWMDYGNINEFVKNNKGFNHIQLLIDAANGLEYMHSINMAHGDLKGANIFINQSLRACLADFGLSTIVNIGCHGQAYASSISLSSKSSLVSFTAGRTTRWTSPELLDPDQFGFTDSRPTTQSDCYAFGMVIYEVLCGKSPFWQVTKDTVVVISILEGDRPQKPEAAEALGFTTGLWKIIQRCWLADATERPDVKGVLFQLNHAAWCWNRKRLK